MKKNQLRINRQRAAVIKALSHPSRILIAEVLVDGAKCVGELTHLIGADISTVSKHLSLMQQSGWIQAERKGVNRFYSLRCPCLMEFIHCVDLISSLCSSTEKKTAA